MRIFFHGQNSDFRKSRKEKRRNEMWIQLISSFCRAFGGFKHSIDVQPSNVTVDYGYSLLEDDDLKRYYQKGYKITAESRRSKEGAAKHFVFTISKYPNTQNTANKNPAYQLTYLLLFVSCYLFRLL
jgi:hypothetical protein